MNSHLYRVRERFHPLNHLWGHRLSRRILRAIDIPVWAKLPGVDGKVRVRLVRHASAFLLPGGVEPGMAALFCAIAKRIGIRSLWDVGANVGYYSWLTKSIAPAAAVRMFEPEPDNIVLIHRTMRRMALSEMTLREVAVSDTHAQQSFVRDEISGSTGGIQQNGSTFSLRQWGVAGKTVTVNTVSLDEERDRVGPVDLIKIDVEGHEEAVIRGGRGTIEHDQPIVIFECFHGGAEIIGFLSSLRYWVGDAERMNDGMAAASNFLALPERYRSRLEALKQSWAAEMERRPARYHARIYR